MDRYESTAAAPRGGSTIGEKLEQLEMALGRIHATARTIERGVRGSRPEPMEAEGKVMLETKANGILDHLDRLLGRTAAIENTLSSADTAL